MFDAVAVVGATGAVGTIICRMLAERKFPFRRIKFLASGRSAGKPLRFADQDFVVEELTPSAFDGVDLAIGSTPDDIARDFVPWAVERGTIVVDESGYWRMDPRVPLVIPEVNPEAVDRHQGIIASPNCSTTQLVVAMKPLHDAARIRRVVVSTYQATSGMGLAGSRELNTATRAALAGEAFAPQAFAHPIAFNLIPQIGSDKERGYTSEEMKMVDETRKILGDESIQICPTCVRVPVDNCHSESILVETEKKLTVEQARKLFAATPGMIVVDDLAAKSYPMPSTCDGRDEVFVGRIREDLSSPNGLAFWCVSDTCARGRDQRGANRRAVGAPRPRHAGARTDRRQRSARHRIAPGLHGRLHADVQVDAGLRRLELLRLANPDRARHAPRNARAGAGQNPARRCPRHRQRTNRCRRARLRASRFVSRGDPSRRRRAPQGPERRVAARHGRAGRGAGRAGLSCHAARHAETLSIRARRWSDSRRFSAPLRVALPLAARSPIDASRGPASGGDARLLQFRDPRFTAPRPAFARCSRSASRASRLRPTTG